MKKILTICLLVLTLVTSFQYLTKPVEAVQSRCPKNSFFPCREEVLQMINKAIAPLQILINSLTTKTDDLEKKAADLEKRVKGLEQIAHCPPGMTPEIRFEGDTSPLKCKPFTNPQPTPPPQPSLQVNCGSTQNGNELQINVTADKSLESCWYTTSASEETPNESGPIDVPTNTNVTPNGNSCSFTENNCGRNIIVTVESFENEVGRCNYSGVDPEPGTSCN